MNEYITELNKLIERAIATMNTISVRDDGVAIIPMNEFVELEDACIQHYCNLSGQEINDDFACKYPDTDEHTKGIELCIHLLDCVYASNWERE